MTRSIFHVQLTAGVPVALWAVMRLAFGELLELALALALATLVALAQLAVELTVGAASLLVAVSGR